MSDAGRLQFLWPQPGEARGDDALFNPGGRLTGYQQRMRLHFETHERLSSCLHQLQRPLLHAPTLNGMGCHPIPLQPRPKPATQCSTPSAWSAGQINWQCAANSTAHPGMPALPLLPTRVHLRPQLLHTAWCFFNSLLVPPICPQLCLDVEEVDHIQLAPAFLRHTYERQPGSGSDSSGGWVVRNVNP